MTDDDCRYVFDGYDTDGTEWFRCETHDELAPSGDAPCSGSTEPAYVIRERPLTDDELEGII